ncbi:hypothetical protein ACTXT7_016587 [Hymenolepis weldensis]
MPNLLHPLSPSLLMAVQDAQPPQLKRLPISHLQLLSSKSHRQVLQSAPSGGDRLQSQPLTSITFDIHRPVLTTAPL